MSILCTTECVINPFHTLQGRQVCLHSGVVSTSEITDDLLTEENDEILLNKRFKLVTAFCYAGHFFSYQKPETENSQ